MKWNKLTSIDQLRLEEHSCFLVYKDGDVRIGEKDNFIGHDLHIENDKCFLVFKDDGNVEIDDIDQSIWLLSPFYGDEFTYSDIKNEYKHIMDIPPLEEWYILTSVTQLPIDKSYFLLCSSEEYPRCIYLAKHEGGEEYLLSNGSSGRLNFPLDIVNKFKRFTHILGFQLPEDVGG